MKKKIISALFAAGILLAQTPAFSTTIGSIDYKSVITNYSKAKVVQNEMEDKSAELQRYLLDKEKEFKKIESPIQRKNFEEQAKKEFIQKQDAFIKYRTKKELEIDTAINNAIKNVAIENKIDAVVDSRVMFFGDVDITDKVVKKLNMGK